MKILNLLPFCLANGQDLGIADVNGPFASSAWCISDALFKSMGGQKFGWFAPDGNNYTEHRDIFSRPTEEQIIKKISPVLKQKAIEQKLIED